MTQGEGGSLFSSRPLLLLSKEKAPFSAGVSLHSSPGLLTSPADFSFCLHGICSSYRPFMALVMRIFKKISLRNRVTDVENNVMVTSSESRGG